jgi:uncharacterized protein (UPF0147 family)
MDNGALNEIREIMESIISDNGVPKNIKRAVQEAKDKINSQGAPEVTITSAIYLLDECLNDINMPFHTRPELMSIISELERIKEEAK